VAAQKGYLDIVKFLVENGANINHQFENGYTPLHVAICEDHSSVAEYLIKNGADVGIISHKGETTIESAMIKADANLVKLIYEHCKNLKILWFVKAKAAGFNL